MDENYQPAMGGQCMAFATATEAQKYRASHESLRKQGKGYGVVEVDWKYNAELSPADKGR